MPTFARRRTDGLAAANRMKADELEQLLGKKITGWAEEETDQYYLMLQLTYGKTVVFRSESPIYVEVEQEQ